MVVTRETRFGLFYSGNEIPIILTYFIMTFYIGLYHIILFFVNNVFSRLVYFCLDHTLHLSTIVHNASLCRILLI